MDRFFDWGLIWDGLPDILDGFVLNLEMMFVAEALTLVWGLVVVLVRTTPGPWGRPLRIIGTVYVDVFRGVPLIVLFALIGFGIPTAFPAVSGVPLFWWAVTALVLAYGAYVAEVYRAGIESVHPSQRAAARALGLSYAKAMRFVILPQAVRRVIPPLMNDFVSLQKDTALASTIGVLDALNVATVQAGNTFNYSPVIGVALCFLVITIPMTRLVDWLVERDRRRMRTQVA